MAPVDHTPAGTTTRPPPALLAASMAPAIAAVQSLSGLAPNEAIWKSRRGIMGGLMRARIASASLHGPVFACGRPAHEARPANAAPPDAVASNRRRVISACERIAMRVVLSIMFRPLLPVSS